MLKAKNLPDIGERQSMPASDGNAKTIRTHDSVAALRQPAHGRLLSLDALRGFDMIWIIGAQEIVKGLAKVFPGKLSEMAAGQLEHVRWQGLHCYDVIWPLFMFMVGVSLSFSLARRKLSGATNRVLYLHALKRALILFVLGMMAQGNLLQFNLATLHPCYSVLHGIAAGYLIATVVMLRFGSKGQAIATAAFLILYWILLISIPVPGVGRGVLTPTGNAATYVDHLVLGRFAFGENTWFLSYLGFAASVLIGGLAGNVLRSTRPAKNKCLFLSAGGIAIVGLGLIWSLWFPIIKLLWTSSFVLVTGGISCLLLAAFYLVIDVGGYRKWAFGFVVIGTNALAVYMATMLFDFRNIGNIFVGHLLPRVGVYSSFLEASVAFTIIWLILYWMYRTKSFVKL
jgi:predicted acyltransferase